MYLYEAPEEQYIIGGAWGKELNHCVPRGETEAGKGGCEEAD